MTDIGRRIFFRKALKKAGCTVNSRNLSSINKVWHSRALALFMTAILVVQLFAIMPSASAESGEAGLPAEECKQVDVVKQAEESKPPQESSAPPQESSTPPQESSAPPVNNTPQESNTPPENNIPQEGNTPDKVDDEKSDIIGDMGESGGRDGQDGQEMPKEPSDTGDNNDNDEAAAGDRLIEDEFESAAASVMEIDGLMLDELMLDIAAFSNPLPAGTNFHGAVSVNLGQYIFTRNGSTITGGESGTLSQWNTANLMVEYNDFTINAEQLKRILDTNEASGSGPAVFVLPRPTGLIWPVNITEKPIPILGGLLDGQVFAHLTVVANGEATIRFYGSFWSQDNIEMINDGEGFINAGHLHIEASLDESTNKTNGDHVIQLAGKSSMTIKVNDFVPAPASINKTGRYNHNGLGELEWTLTYNPGSPISSAMYPVVITDSFGSGHTLDPVLDNMVLTYGSGSTATIVVGAAINGLVRNGTTGFTLTIEEGSAYAGQPLTLTYRSYPNQNLIGNNVSRNFDNSAVLKHNGIDIDTATRRINIPAAQNRWIGKEGVQVGRDIEWTVTISTLHQSLRNLIFHDTMGSALTLVGDSIKINGASATTTTMSGNSFTIDLSDFYSPGALPGTITIIYRTTVNEGFFDNPGEGTPNVTNSAHLTFEWEWRGNGVWGDVVSPTMSRNPGINRDIIKKTAISTTPVNAASQLITWRIDVNPYNVYIPSGTITDIPNPDGTEMTHIYVGEPTGDAVTKDYITFTAGSPVFTITDKLGNNSTHFYVTTQATNPELIGGNTDTIYSNRARFNGIVRFGGETGSDQPMTDTADADVNYRSRVLNKTATGFRYVNESLIVTWEITVNQNAMELEDVVLTDKLGEGLRFVGAVGDTISVRPGSSGTISVAGISGSVSSGGQTLSFTHSGGFDKQQVVFRYDTEVDVDIINFGANANITVSNTATLAHSGHPGVNVDASRVIPNRFLVKDGSINDGVISYSVQINPYGLNLDDAEKGRVLTDVFPLTPTVGGLPPLVLNPQSLQLWEATTTASASGTSNGSYTMAKTSVNATSAATITYHTSGTDSIITGFSIALPKADQAYILEYQCSVRGTIDVGQTFNGNISNSISFGGDAAHLTSTSDQTFIGLSGGSGTGGFAAILTLRKVNALRNDQGIAGVEFRVYQRLGGLDFEVVRGVTDASGEVRLRMPPAGSDVEYIIREYGVDGFVANTLKLLDGNGNPTFTGGATAGDFSMRSISGDTLGVSFSRHGGYRLTVTNDPVITNDTDIMLTVNAFEIVKPDRLDKVVFELWRDDNGKWVKEDSKKTDSSGFVVFESLYNYTAYKVIAVSPDGYYQTDSEYAFSTGHDANAHYHLDWAFHPRGGSITIDKVGFVEDGPNIPLAGVWFDLYKVMSANEDDDILVDSAVSDINGEVVFKGIPLSFDGAASSVAGTDPENLSNLPMMDVSLGLEDTVYRIVERWFAGYHPTYPKIKDTLTPSDQVHRFDWINYPGEGEITLTVLDSETGEPLSGVSFALYGPLNGVSTRMGVATSDSFGMLSFTGLPLGSGNGDGSMAMAFFDTEPIIENGGSIEFTKKQLNDLDGYDSLSAPIVTTLSTTMISAEVEAELDPINGNGDYDDSGNQGNTTGNNTGNNQNTGGGNTGGNTGGNNSGNHDGDQAGNTGGSTGGNTLNQTGNRNTPNHEHKEAALPRTGVDSAIGMLLVGLLTSIAMGTAVFVVIKLQGKKSSYQY